MLVYVINKNNRPLMPCKPSKARKLLRDGKAKCIRRTPFTIKLLWDCTEYVQDLTLGIDSGSKTIGSAVRDDKNNVFYISNVHLRTDVKSKMDQRRMYRRNRRGRKTRYRQPRFLNRQNSIKDNRYPPTISNKYNTHDKEIRFICKLLPIKTLVIETATFDPHAMQNPKVLNCPWLYQKGIQVGYYNTKAYILDRDKYICQNCKGKSKEHKLNVHHILSRSNGGSDLPANLITLCKTCHTQLHAGVFSLQKTKLKSLLNHATHMNILQSIIRKSLTYTETYGYITKAIREYFGIIKDHCYDAVCCSITKDILPNFKTDRIIIKQCTAKGTYQRSYGSRSEKLFPKSKVFGFKTYDKVLYKNLVYFIKGKMSTGYAVLMNIYKTKIDLKPIPKFILMKRLSARSSWMIF
jgi:hypothetical protein